MEATKTIRSTAARWGIALASVAILLVSAVPAFAAPAAPTNVAIVDGDDGFINLAEASAGLTIAGDYDSGDGSITTVIARVTDATGPQCDLAETTTTGVLSTPVDGSGSFSIGPFDVSGFAEGAALCARVRMVAGATNGDLGVGAIRPTLDRVAPGLPGMTFVTNPVNAANQSAAEVSVSGGAGNTVEVFIEDGTDSTATQSVVLGSPHTFSFDVSALADGTLSARGTQADPAGNVSGVRTRTSLKDATEPGAGLIEWLGDAADGYINRADDDANIPVSWTANPSGDAATASGIFTDDAANTPLAVNCGPWALPVTSTGALPQTCTDAMPEGPVHFVVDWTDAAGNTSTGSASVIIDRIRPTPTFIDPVNGDAFPPGYTVPVSGTTEGLAELRYRLDGVTIGTDTAAADGSFSLELANLSNGPHTLNVRATDLAGNVGSRNLNITIDPLIPMIVDPIAGSINGRTVTVRGTGIPDTVVDVMQGALELNSTEVDSRGQWELQVALSPGTHTICARARDGLTISQCSPDRTFSVTSAAPTVAITTDDLALDPTEITGSATANGGVKTVIVEYFDFVRGVKFATVTASCSTACDGTAASVDWTAPIPDAVGGLVLVRATSYDSAGAASQVASIRIVKG